MKLFKNVGLLFLLIFFSFLLFTESNAAPQPQMPVGRVVWIKGTLKAIMENKEERILKEKSIIYLHDTLVTTSGSEAQIGFTDQTQMTFRAGTTFNVSNYRYSRSQKGGKSAMNLIEGGFRTITGAVAKDNPNNYSVDTPVATIGVRGTEYQTQTHGDTTYLGWYSGTPCITLKKNPQCAQNRLENTSTGDSDMQDGADKKGAYTVCLSASKRWAKVVAPCGKPEVLTDKPDVFDQDLTMIQTTIDPFNDTGDNGGIRRTNDFCIR